MRLRLLAFSLVLGALAAGSGACGYMPADAAAPDGGTGAPGNPGGSVTPTADATGVSTDTPTPLPTVDPAGWTFQHLSSPSRTEVHGPDGEWLATLTDNAYTVTLHGPARSIAEPTAAAPVQSSTWVRILPAPFSGTFDDSVKTWVQKELSDTTPDILQLGLQYIADAPPQTDQGGLQIAGDADYGPLQADGTRQEGSDYNDYLGITINYPDGSGSDKPEAAQFHCLDCSGFVRMVFGYRSGMRMTIATDGQGILLPRRAVQIVDTAPGVMLIPNTLTQPTDMTPLAPGDLVFFDASTNDGTLIDHVGIYLGVDTQGHYRFISSRKTENGPTLGDNGGSSILDGNGFYAKAYRAARRL